MPSALGCGPPVGAPERPCLGKSAEIGRNRSTDRRRLRRAAAHPPPLGPAPSTCRRAPLALHSEATDVQRCTSHLSVRRHRGAAVHPPPFGPTPPRCSRARRCLRSCAGVVQRCTPHLSERARPVPALPHPP